MIESSRPQTCRRQRSARAWFSKRMLMLSGIFVCLSALAVGCSDPGPPPGNDVISDALGTEGVMIFDVRSAEEYAQGHVDGAVHLPVSEVRDRIAVLVPDKHEQVVLYCASGNRASEAERELRSMGYTQVLNAKTASAVAKAQGKRLVK